MAVNYPGPYQVRIHYEVNPNGDGILEHVIQLNVDLEVDPTPGDPFSLMSALRRDTGGIDLDVATAAFVNVAEDLFDTGEGSFTYAELWKYTPDTFLASYVSSLDLSLPFTGLGTSYTAGQDIYTFRTLEGGIMRVELHENLASPGPAVAYADLAADPKALADYFITNNTGVWLARDTSYPFLCLRESPGQSEATFKKRYRS